MSPPDRQQHDEYIHRYQPTGVRHIVGTGREVAGLRTNSTIFPFRLDVSEVPFADRKIYVGFIHDLSREKQAEEQLKAYAAHLEELVGISSSVNLNQSLLKNCIINLLQMLFDIREKGEQLIQLAYHSVRKRMAEAMVRLARRQANENESFKITR